MKTDSIFEIYSEETFNEKAIEIFRFQYKNTILYRHFVDYLGKDIRHISHYTQIPFLPIEFFKSAVILHQNRKPNYFFQSSGTSHSIRAKHYFQDHECYKRSLLKGFTQFIRNPEECVFLGLLPNYLENPHSSLIYMVNTLMECSQHQGNGYFLEEEEALYQSIKKFQNTEIQLVLFGVSFALLDFIEKYTVENTNLMVLETGGMKGRKTEITKEEVLTALRRGFPNAVIGSEYGMTELFSQAYAFNSLYYKSPPWMKLLIRQLEDPLSFQSVGKSGAINIIDFANIYSCSFIASSDLGKMNEKGEVEILGRIDNSDIRGCSLLL